LVGASTRREAWDEQALSSFGDNLAEPARARAARQMCRTFNLREAPAILRGRYADQKLTVPTLLLFGIDDIALRFELLDGYEAHAKEMEVELVEGCGHFIADEQPELVAARAREFLALK
jgi:pimeloyl-ACP methyl ester carboxylesterase